MTPQLGSKLQTVSENSTMDQARPENLINFGWLYVYFLFFHFSAPSRFSEGRVILNFTTDFQSSNTSKK